MADISAVGALVAGIRSLIKLCQGLAVRVHEYRAISRCLTQSSSYYNDSLQFS